MKRKIKENYKFIIILILFVICFTIKFPYYINAPGGITDMSKKMEINGYESKGSFNLAYVREYKATIPTFLISLFNKNWKVLKQNDVLLNNETNNSYLLRDKILMNESISNAINVAFKYAGKKIDIISTNLYITYIDGKANTNLVVGDIITKINNKSINSKTDITNIINKYSVGEKLDIQVINNKKKYNRYAYIIEEDNQKKLGLFISVISQYDTYPSVNIKVDENESGSSGGLITALTIYNALVKEDITNGLIIVGTGTIDLDGNIGSIGGVEYKLKSAVKKHADVFIVPNDENYEEALKIKENNNYDIDIVGVSTFEETLKYLKNMN